MVSLFFIVQCARYKGKKTGKPTVGNYPSNSPIKRNPALRIFVRNAVPAVGRRVSLTPAALSASRAGTPPIAMGRFRICG